MGKDLDLRKVFITDQKGMARMHIDGSDLNTLTRLVIGESFTVLNALGAGFLENAYENALAHELRKRGLQVAQQRGITVVYDNVVVGEYTADLLIQNVLIAELKAVKNLDEVHTAQCINYLKGSGLKVCLLLNFGNPKLQIKRIAN
jgi:GxxExxY protein